MCSAHSSSLCCTTLPGTNKMCRYQVCTHPYPYTTPYWLIKTMFFKVLCPLEFFFIVGQYRTNQNMVLYHQHLIKDTGEENVLITFMQRWPLHQTFSLYCRNITPPVDKGAVYIPCAVSCNSHWSYLYPQIFIPPRPLISSFK